VATHPTVVTGTVVFKELGAIATVYAPLEGLAVRTTKNAVLVALQTVPKTIVVTMVVGESALVPMDPSGRA